MRKMFLVPCLSMVIALGSTMVSMASTGWAQENGTWVYYTSSKDKATDTLKKSGNNWYYLDENGEMATDRLVEYNDDFYYVNSTGAVVTNEWKAVPNESPSEGEPDEWWYYFQSNGKAVKKPSGANTAKLVTLTVKSGTAKYIFDENGHMMSGWINENGEMLTEDDAWKSGVYYAGGNDDGKIVTGWKYITAENDEDTDRDGDGYWFYFKTNGKKITDTDSKTINGKKYRFNEHGAAQFDWYNKPTVATGSEATPSDAVNRYYNEENQTWLATGWFKTVPSEDVDAEAHNNDESHWFYADKKGDLTKAQIKAVNGQKYGFDVNGKMLHGLYKITFADDNKTIERAVEIENEADIPTTSEDGVYVYYFGNSPKEGAMITGDTSIEIDGETYQYRFKKSGAQKGAGADGIEDNAIYVMGKRLKADKDSKYEAVTYNDEQYLINTSGKLMKNAKNQKDADDVYYCTDKKGVITYKGTEKYKK